MWPIFYPLVGKNLKGVGLVVIFLRSYSNHIVYYFCNFVCLFFFFFAIVSASGRATKLIITHKLIRLKKKETNFQVFKVNKPKCEQGSIF